MKAHHPLHVLGLMLLTTPALARPTITPAITPKINSERAVTIPPTETSALRSCEDPSLGELRAGALARGGELPASECAALRQAESASPDLGALRGGNIELSDRDLTIIAIVVGIVLILVLL